MLSRITIRDLVIVRSLDLSFAAGMTALTGETGAGKSILIDALGLALGDKPSSAMIRSGADRAEVSAAFELADGAAALDWLAAHDLAADGECLLRRVLVRDGRSRAYINGTPATQALLRELGQLLVDIHGQHAHQSLLHAAAQRQLLDAYGGLRDAVRDVGEHYRDWQRRRAALAELQRASDDRASRLDYLDFQIAELGGCVLDAAALKATEDEHARLANAERLMRDSAAALSALSDDDNGVRQILYRVHHDVAELAELDGTLAEVRDLLDNAGIQIDEASSALRHYHDAAELDPGRLQEIDDRLGRLYELARKHRVAPAELSGLLGRLQREADELEHADSRLVDLERQTLAAENAYGEAADRLSKARAEAAVRLAGTVTDSLQELGMRGARLRIDVARDDARPAASGVDRVTFNVAANPGQHEGTLADVASGGELSRISLAIQVATADCGRVPTLIFDEVDVGIGGAVAEIVGKLLRRLGSQRQVLCVTHLAQVASQAHRHSRVLKITDGKATETRIDTLDDDARVDEVARMMGGVAITEQTRRHADEMIRAARNTG
ncbi:MAG: DNA repair protein RecN [Gammaproteobacteria bacterium]|nr:DNA repair protein RecN [Gammaproteobacteria bacterium]